MRVKQAQYWHRGNYSCDAVEIDGFFMLILCILPLRGAELIESLRKKQVKLQAQREEEILQKIKQKMDRIKANQQKLQPALSTPKTHYQGKYNV